LGILRSVDYITSREIVLKLRDGHRVVGEEQKTLLTEAFPLTLETSDYSDGPAD
jgi:hypothetical protein